MNGAYHYPTPQASPTTPQAPSTNVTRPPPIDIHEFWKGRLAPFPGYTSRPDLLGRPESNAATITRPAVSPLTPPPSSSSLLQVSPTTSTISEIDSPVSASPKKPHKLDRYADAYVPEYLRKIQKQPHKLTPFPATQDFPPRTYIQSFLPSVLVDNLCAPRAKTLLADTPPTTESSHISLEGYHAHWKAVLGWELDTLAKDKQEVTLWQLPISVANWINAEFRLDVPHIRESYPRLELGDLVHMREVVKDQKVGSGVAFEGRIVALRKREGFVHLCCPALKRYIQTHIRPTHSTAMMEGSPAFGPLDELGLYFNVSFIINARPLFLMEAAADTFANELALPESKWPNFARRWLFPEPTDLSSTCSISFPLPKTIEVEDYIDQGLNEEQKLAAVSISTQQFSVPYLISGPPGTGKTRTLVECVLQILRLQPEACILLCAPSNPATDTLVLRLRHFLKPSEMLRLNDQHRTFAEVPVEIFSYCRIEDEKFAVPPWPELMKFRVVVTTCYDGSILVNAQCTNTALAQLEQYVMSALHPRRDTSARGVVPHWTHLLIDEAAQGSEPELLIPMSVVVPRQQDYPDFKPESNFLFTPQLVLCGDANQLGPIVASSRARSSELDVSLLERLFQRALYAEHPQSRGKAVDSATPREEFVPFVNLVKNYRSHPVILMPPSAIIYNDTLEPCAKNGAVAWAGLPKRDIPLVFIGHEGDEDCIDERSSWFNSGDIQHVVDTVKSLMADSVRSTPPLQQKDIGVMAPWREQVWKLRERLRKENLHAVDVGTVEDYQGRESRVVIISCVRSRARFLAEDLKKALGLVFERKRMNVALTRAKELLVVVGNGNLLRRDPYWKSFLQFTQRHDLYMGPRLDLEVDGNYISRLESEYFDGDEVDEDVRGLRMAGSLAREVLREEDKDLAG